MDLSLEAGIDRRGTQCLKWDTTPEGVLPMWVADMDFPCAPGILEALRKRLEHPVFGYTRMSDADKQAIVDYYARRHGMKLCGEEMLFTPGVVDSLLLSVHALTAPGDKVLIQSPVYGPFSGVIRRAKREIVENPLVQTGVRPLRDGPCGPGRAPCGVQAHAPVLAAQSLRPRLGA